VDWSVTVRVHYVVTAVGQSQPVFDEMVAATGQAGDAGLTAQVRVRHATEAAVRADIAAFVDRLQRGWGARSRASAAP
jgi:hypothetical protein